MVKGTLNNMKSFGGNFVTCSDGIYMGSKMSCVYPSMQPRPQGAFPWLWEKRPGDEVAQHGNEAQT